MAALVVLACDGRGILVLVPPVLIGVSVVRYGLEWRAQSTRARARIWT